MMLESRNSAHGATAIEDRAGYSLALVVGAGGIVASVIVALLVGRLLTEQARTDFRTQADSWKTSLQKTLHANLIVLDQFKAFFAASRQVEPEEFTLYAQCIRTNHPTVVALEYARCVPRSARPHFEASHTNESGQPLIIGQMLAPEVRTLIPAYDRDVYFPVEFIVGEPGDGLLHGFDLMSEPVRAHALQRALETGSAVATTGIRLHQQTDATLSFLVFLPIPKQPPLAPPADALPWTRSDGVVAAAFNVSRLVQAAVWDEQFLRALRIDEVTSSPPGSASTGAAAPHPQPIFRASAPADQDRPRHPDWIYESLLNVDGHDTLWNLTFTPTPAMLRFRPAQSIGGTLAIGLLVTGLVVSRLITSARCTVAAYRTNRQLQEALASEESALREASHFDAITQKISSGWSLHQILDYVYESFIALLPYDRITFAVLEKDGREARSVWSRSRGQHGKSPDEYRTSLEGSSLDELLKQGQPRVLDELSSFLESHPSSRTTRLLIEDGMRSSMTCPLTANGRTVGFLSFSCRRPNAYNEAHVQRFARVARQVSVTVERARYCEELEAEMGLRRKAERALRRVYEAPRDRYQTGGSLRHDSPSYVERSADRLLFEGLMRGELCYVLTSRQMGKSSLMARTAERLRQQSLRVLTFDLTATGFHVTAEQWYYGLLTRMGWQLDREDDLERLWQTRAQLGPGPRFFTALRTALTAEDSSPSIVFIDELDAVRSLPFSSNEFFASIREFHNAGDREGSPHRIAFCLLGAAPPGELVQNPEVTPFNVVGKRVVLNDFTLAEALSLAPGLDRPPNIAEELMERVYHWTNGQPYLVQTLCHGIVADPAIQTRQDVDELCHRHFFSPSRREEDVNIAGVRDSLLRSPLADQALELYKRVRVGEPISADPENPATTHLLFCGLLSRGGDSLRVRNRIYEQVFGPRWVERQRERLHAAA